MNSEVKEESLTKSQLPAEAEMPAAERDVNRDFKQLAVGIENADVSSEGERLAPLFAPDVAKEFRSRWDAVQSSFVDDPRQAVRQGDELVAQVMKRLAETFSNERARLEGQSDRTDKASTENLRIALRRYHSFFERLLAL